MKFIELYGMQFLYWILLGLVTFLIKKLKEYKNVLFQTQSGIKNLLRNEIMELYSRYKSFNSITLEQKQNIDKLYEVYKLNGGNGFVDDLMDEIKEKSISSNNYGGD